nr:lysylphosphatidylglycerol synthase domain-containing protein [uncultured Acidocella sp.]
MRRAQVIALFLAGLGLATAAVLWLGAGKVLHALSTLGPGGLAAILLWQLAVFIILAGAWRVLLPGAPFWLTVWGRLVREGGETCLPFSEIGGLVFGTRAVMLGGASLPRAAASSLADMICEAAGLVPFILIGLGLLLARAPHDGLIWPLAGGLVLLLAGAGGGYLGRRRLARLARGAVTRLLRPWTKSAPREAEAMQAQTTKLLHDRPRLALAALIHFLAWCAGAGNIWLAYHFLGAAVSPVAALGIESLLSSVLAVAFLVPAALGVQELAYIAIGGAFGVPPHLSLALSFIRRARDILIGAPALAIWQGLEARRLRQRTKEA